MKKKIRLDEFMKQNPGAGIVNTPDGNYMVPDKAAYEAAQQRQGDDSTPTILTSTGCPAMDALDLADAVLEGTVTGKEIIAKLLHINDLINEERKRGEVQIVPTHVAAMPSGGDSGSGLYQ